MGEQLTVSKQGLETEAASWAEKARGLAIVDRESCINASTLLRSVKALRSGIADFFGPHLNAAMETKRRAEAARKGLSDEQARMEAPLVEAEGVLKRALLAFETQQEQARLEEQRALQAEAQRRAEAMTLAVAADMELEASATGDEGLRQEAQDILSQPIYAPIVTVEKMAPKVQGITYRDNWRAHETVNVKALAAAVASGTVPATFLTPNMPALNAYARATKGTETVPGVNIFNDRTIAARG